jgi:hypothetical protein
MEFEVNSSRGRISRHSEIFAARWTGENPSSGLGKDTETRGKGEWCVADYGHRNRQMVEGVADNLPTVLGDRGPMPGHAIAGMMSDPRERTAGLPHSALTRQAVGVSPQAVRILLTQTGGGIASVDSFHSPIAIEAVRTRTPDPRTATPRRSGLR